MQFFIYERSTVCIALYFVPRHNQMSSAKERLLCLFCLFCLIHLFQSADGIPMVVWRKDNNGDAMNNGNNAKDVSPGYCLTKTTIFLNNKLQKKRQGYLPISIFVIALSNHLQLTTYLT